MKIDKRFYVYALIDPRDGQIFYVGKGTKDRLRQHVQNVKRGREQNLLKEERIHAIWRSGHLVVEKILHEGLDEDTALGLEKGLIDGRL